MIAFCGGFENCLVFYWWVTNYHKLSGLKEHFLLTHSFCSWEIEKDSTGPLLSSHRVKDKRRKQVSHRVKDKMLSIILPGSSGKEFYSSLIQVAGRNQFLVTVRLKSLFPFWLLARNCFLILYVTWIPWHVPPPFSSPQWHGKSFLCFESIWPHLPTVRKFSSFKELCD